MAGVPARYQHYLDDDIELRERVRPVGGRPSGAHARSIRESRLQQLERAARHIEINLQAPLDLDALKAEAYASVRERYVRERKPMQPLEEIDPAVLNRWAVNYVRHRCTSYENALEDAWAIAEYNPELYRGHVRRRILGLIADRYPQLEQECLNQRAQQIEGSS